MHEHKSVNNIIMSSVLAPLQAVSLPSKPQKHEFAYKGTPAKYLTFGEMLALREREEDEKRCALEKKKEERIKKDKVRAEKREMSEQIKNERESKRAERKAAKKLEQEEKMKRKRTRAFLKEANSAKRNRLSADASEISMISALVCMGSVGK